MTVFDLDELVLRNRRLTGIASLSYRQNDRLSWPLRILQNEQMVELPSGSTLSVGIKRSRSATAYLALATEPAKTGTGQSTIYTFDLNLNTVEMAAALSTGDSIEDCVLEVEVMTPTQRLTSRAVTTSIQRDLINGGEPPLPAMSGGGGGGIYKSASFTAEVGKTYIVGVPRGDGGASGSGSSGSSEGGSSAEGSGSGEGAVGEPETHILITLPLAADIQEGDTILVLNAYNTWKNLPVHLLADAPILGGNFNVQNDPTDSFFITWNGTAWVFSVFTTDRFRHILTESLYKLILDGGISSEEVSLVFQNGGYGAKVGVDWTGAFILGENHVRVLAANGASKLVTNQLAASPASGAQYLSGAAGNLGVYQGSGTTDDFAMGYSGTTAGDWFYDRVNHCAWVTVRDTLPPILQVHDMGYMPLGGSYVDINGDYIRVKGTARWVRDASYGPQFFFSIESDYTLRWWLKSETGVTILRESTNDLGHPANAQGWTTNNDAVIGLTVYGGPWGQNTLRLNFEV